jgi:hypothetical protein
MRDFEGPLTGRLLVSKGRPIQRSQAMSRRRAPSRAFKKNGKMSR